jgi:NAD(P)-dependent dehydrogenase (short-subunit alcohol dehydrogenase family)
MFGPYTPTLLAVLTKSGMLNLNTRGVQRVRGKTAVVTGAASGIGEAIARACVERGCTRLLLADISWSHNTYLANELEKKGCNVLQMEVDVGEKAKIQEMHDACIENFGAPHLLFNNAGTGMPGLLSATDESLERSFDINFWSVAHATRIFVPTMEAAHGHLKEPCHIMNTASLAGISEGCGLYGITKHAVVALTESVASELAWRKSNVEVSTLCPSYVKTNVVRTTQNSKLNAPADGDEGRSLGKDEMEQVQEQLSLLPKLIENGQTPDEVAEAAFDGIAGGKRYVFPNLPHALAALSDRNEQFRAGGYTAGFERQMETIISDELEK